MGIDIGKYKQDLMKFLIESPIIVEALQNEVDGSLNPEDLIKKSIFPYLKVKLVETEVKSYILMGVSERRITRNDTFGELTITFRVLSHDNHMDTDYGYTRIDYIAEEMKRIFIGNYKIGCKTLVMLKNEEYVYDEKHQFREMVFRTVDFNADGDNEYGNS